MWEVSKPPKPTRKQLAYIEHLIDQLDNRGLRFDTLEYRPRDKQEASKMIDNLKGQLGWG
jgi:hypothetical protein